MDKAFEALLRPTASAVIRISRELGEKELRFDALEDDFLIFEFSGDEADVAADLAWIQSAGLSPRYLSSDWAARVHQLQANFRAEEAIRFQFGIVDSKVSRLVTQLRALGIPSMAYLGTGNVFGFLTATDSESGAALSASEWDGLWKSLQATAKSLGASMRLEMAPPMFKIRQDIYGEQVSGLKWMKALKRQFDPQGTLSPGRFVGGI